MSGTLPSIVARATALLKAGRPAEAVPFLRAAATAQPGNAEIAHDLGLACLEAGAALEAVGSLRQAIAIKPRYADAHFRLGIAYERLGEHFAALQAYDQATRILPSFTEAWFRAGALAYSLGHAEEAIGCFRRAASSGPKTPLGRLAVARALLTEERDQEAEKSLRQLLALDPGNPMALDLLGNLLAESGRFDEARSCFARAVAEAPLMAGSYYDLVRCRRIGAADAELLPHMQAALDTAGLEEEQRLRLHLAIGKAAEDLGDPALAMRHFDAASALRDQLVPFDAEAFETQVARLIAWFTPERVREAEGNPAETPVFIVGMPRSGTTLLEQIVSSHPDVAACGEVHFWTARGVDWVRRDMPGPGSDFLTRAAAEYLARLRAQSRGAARATDKMPFNFLWAGLIHLALPNATIIHCRRAAIDTALSIHQTHFSLQLAFPTGGVALVRYFRSYERITDHWRRVLPPSRFIDSEYAALTSDPAPHIRSLIASCGLDWHEACLSPEANPRAVKTPSRWQARQKINRASLDRWRSYAPYLGAFADLLAQPP
jgi:Tfp pilus assembly protein PilF